MKIYLDLTFGLNFFLCLIIFTLYDLVFPNKLKLTRKFLASLVGSSFSILLIVYPSFFSGLIPKFLFFIIICFIAFGFESLDTFFRKSICLFVISFIGAGVLIWINMERTGNVTILNPIFDVTKMSRIIFFFLGLVIFIPITRIFILNAKSIFNNNKLIYSLEIWAMGRETTLKGFLDTGNSLYDPISKLPVVIVNKDKVKKLLGPEWEKWFQTGDIWNIPIDSKVKISFIPFKSVGGEEVLIAIKPDKVMLVSPEGKTQTSCLIGLNPKSSRMHPGVDALIHPTIIS